MKRFLLILIAVVVAALIFGSLRDPEFWQSADRRGDRLMRNQKFAEAAKAYSDPERIGMAQYRNGDFKEAAQMFARVPGADGAFDQGNAQLMHGNYDAAITSYDRALSFRPGWEETTDNKQIAQARKAKIEAGAKDAAQEDTGQEKPDEIVFDQKGQDQKGKPIELSGGNAMNDQDLQATWLRRVQTTPGDFLRAKFAYQEQGGTK